MDLIGKVTHIENPPDARKRYRGKTIPARKNIRSDAAGEKNAPVDDPHPFTENGSLLGLQVNTTA